MRTKQERYVGVNRIKLREVLSAMVYRSLSYQECPDTCCFSHLSTFEATLVRTKHDGMVSKAWCPRATHIHTHRHNSSNQPTEMQHYQSLHADWVR